MSAASAATGESDVPALTTATEVDVGVELPDGVQCLVAQPGGEDGPVGMVGVQGAQDGDHLLGGLA